MTGSQLARLCSNRTADGTLAGPWKPTLWLESGQQSQFFSSVVVIVYCMDAAAKTGGIP